jgi:hypothetical protein
VRCVHKRFQERTLARGVVGKQPNPFPCVVRRPASLPLTCRTVPFKPKKYRLNLIAEFARIQVLSNENSQPRVLSSVAVARNADSICRHCPAKMGLRRTEKCSEALFNLQRSRDFRLFPKVNLFLLYVKCRTVHNRKTVRLNPLRQTGRRRRCLVNRH